MPELRLPHGNPAPNTLAPESEWDDFRGPCTTWPEMWFATDADTVAYAKSVCGGCPMREACLRAALELDARHGPQDGVWGGKDKDERKRLARNRKRPSRAKADAGPFPCPKCERVFANAQALGHHRVKGHASHCRNGHEWKPETTRVRGDGVRECRSCDNEQRRARRQREAS